MIQLLRNLRKFILADSNVERTRQHRLRRCFEVLEPRAMLAAGISPLQSSSAMLGTAFSSCVPADEIEILFAPRSSAESAAQVEGPEPLRDPRGTPDASDKAAAVEASPVTSSPWERFQTANRWGSTATSGSELGWGDATTITWSIVPDGTSISGFAGEQSGPSDFVSFMNGIYGSTPGTASEQPWFPLVASAFERWSDVSGLNFLYEPNDDGAAFSSSASRAPGAIGVRGDVRIGGHRIDGNSGTLAYNFFPDNGEMVLDTSDRFFLDTSENSLRLRNVMAHELGHGIGLSHAEPVNQTKLMEPFASTSFDGPQHADILAVHRVYGDPYEVGAGNDSFRTAIDLGAIDHHGIVAGDVGSDEYLSIDGTTDTDYFRFAVTREASLTAALSPVGQSYQQGADGDSTASIDSKSQNDLSLEIYDASHRIVGRANARGLGKVEALSGLRLSAGREYFVRIQGDRDRVQLYQLELNATAIAARETIDFNKHSISRYGGSQDQLGTAIVRNDGATLHLTGDRWKMIDYTYIVTPNTVLEFDFSSTAQGDIHGIGFDSNTSISSGLTFRLYGAQSWGLDRFATYNSADASRHYEIPVGEFYTGKATALFFVNDHDVKNPTAESVFSNVRIYEKSQSISGVLPPHAVNDHIALNEDSPTVAFNALGNDDDGGGRLSITEVGPGSAGGEVSLGSDGRIHYRPAADFAGTESFVYTAANGAGTSTATVTVTVRPVNDPPVANDNRYAVIGGHSYRLNVLKNDSTGGDSGETLTIVRIDGSQVGGRISTDGRYVTYTPAAGFVGTETFTYTINDGKQESQDTGTITIYVRPATSRIVSRFDRVSLHETPSSGSILHCRNMDQALTTLFPDKRFL